MDGTQRRQRLHGKQLRALLRQVAFVKVQASASYDAFDTAEGTRHWGGVMAAQIGA